MNKVKGGILLAFIVGALVLTPIALYGTQVDVAKVSFDLSVESPLTTASVADFESQQLPSFIVDLANPQVEVTSMNPYEYILARNTARTQVSGEGTEGEAFVEITITFNLTTPSNESLVFTLTPGMNQGTGDRAVTVLVGPEDGIATEGEFQLSITITVKVTPPGFDDPVVDMTLTPVNMTFVVPTGS